MENLGMSAVMSFWEGKSVLITGHTGFKGSWLCLILSQLGAKISGYSLPPHSSHNLFDYAEINAVIDSNFGDVRDFEALLKCMGENRPEIVFHLAAQPIVRDSYRNPLTTIDTNILGTANVLEAVKRTKTCKSIINVTTDKVYENKEWIWSYRENENLGGYDIYSASKACSELVTNSFYKSFLEREGIGTATARSGNVLGGGDWAADRIVPDILKALYDNENLQLRNPNAIRPWQHVLDPLFGYLTLAENLWNDSEMYSSPWNFGPETDKDYSVEQLVNIFRLCSNRQINIIHDDEQSPHEAEKLRLDISKSKHYLGWSPRWSIKDTVEKILEWENCYRSGANVQETCLKQIDQYRNPVANIKI